METKKLANVSGAVLVLFLISLFIFPQLVAQDSVRLTQADMVDMLVEALGLEDELGTATMEEKVDKLTELGYALPRGWELEKPLLKRDVNVILAQIARGSESDDDEKELSRKDLMGAINAAAAPPGWENTPPYHDPVSPNGWENAKWNRD